MPDSHPSPLARALGRVPSGLFIVTSLLDGRPVGFVGSFVAQTGLAPPTICVAIAKGRDHLLAIRQQQGFVVSVLDPQSQGAMGAFFKRREDGSSPFDELSVRPAPSGPPIVTEALAWLDCRLASEHATGDHVVCFGEVEAGDCLREGDPSVHLRADGLSY
ncbi:MAG: flavin reductase family protein [Planctomycetota bacterium]|jgi:flavin reductase (DIM6/NTAB) family NADH-FMN oxidoreductase RutF|nr:flavin reductase family protein [Planctomycetota bacterium]MDP6762677.1 flavin reductase family protein [Planctomycetota bacterium]MDP6989986.1 flavin reductase family protein [Planctomycetota bacterium]